jgi:hypothetical protein
MSEGNLKPGYSQYKVASYFLFPVALLGNTTKSGWEWLGVGGVPLHVIQAAGDVAVLLGFLLLIRAYQKALVGRESQPS